MKTQIADPITAINPQGEAVNISPSALASLQSQLKGNVEVPTPGSFPAAYNPALLIRCKNSSDVSTAIRFVRKHSLMARVKDAGMHVSNPLEKGCVLIDLSSLNQIVINPSAERIHFGPGVSRSRLEAAALMYDWNIPSKLHKSTYSQTEEPRFYRLSANGLRAIEIVTPDGEILIANESKEKDIFWCIKRGGSFGIITSVSYHINVP